MSLSTPGLAPGRDALTPMVRNISSRQKAHAIKVLRRPDCGIYPLADPA